MKNKLFITAIAAGLCFVAFGCKTIPVDVSTSNIDKMIDTVIKLPDSPEKKELITQLQTEKKTKEQTGKVIAAQQQKVEKYSTDAGKWYGVRNTAIAFLFISVIIGVICLYRYFRRRI
jgi:hypothetical protein